MRADLVVALHECISDFCEGSPTSETEIVEALVEAAHEVLRRAEHAAIASSGR